MTTNELKDILATKLHDEGCYFTKKDIKATKIKDGWEIVIKDYEHIPFRIVSDTDDYFGYCVFVYRVDGDELTNLYFFDSKRDYDWEDAIIYLGYYIGTRF